MIEHPDSMAPNPGGESPEQETASLPLSILGGQQVVEGDVVKLKVIGVDSEGGMFDVAYEHSPKPKPAGIDKMSAAFDSEPETEG